MIAASHRDAAGFAASLSAALNKTKPLWLFLNPSEFFPAGTNQTCLLCKLSNSVFCLGFKPLTQKKEKEVRKENPGTCAAVSRRRWAASAQETLCLLPLVLLWIEKEKFKHRYWWAFVFMDIIESETFPCALLKLFEKLSKTFLNKPTSNHVLSHT